MQTSRLIKLILSLLVVATLACQCAGFGLPGTPTVQPTPTLEPFAPVVADHFPGRGDELSPDDAIDIYFDQPMDRASVEAAFSIVPPVAGSFLWLDDSAVQFKPSAALELATRYKVAIGTAAKSKNGLPLRDTYTFNADTVGFLEVTQVLPTPDSRDVDVNSLITIMFNRPVVPLALSADAATLPSPVTFDPPLSGTGEWLNTSIFTFRPDTPLSGGVTYTGRIASGLADSTGGVLKEEFAWSFTTQPPSVVVVDPFFGSLDVPLTQEIVVSFNQPMDKTTAQKAFSLSAGDRSIAGSFEWSDDLTVMTFKPSSPLGLGQTYSAGVGVGALAADGKTPLTDDYRWTFNTASAPGVLATDPHNGGSIDSYSGVYIYFASPMDEDTLQEKHIVISPEAKIGYTYYNSYDKSLYISANFEASTDYTITLDANMADPYGNPLGEPYQWQFSTEPLDPLVTLNTRGEIGVYSAYTPTSLYATYRNYYDLSFSLYRMPLNDLGRYYALDGYDYRQNYAPSELLRSWALPVDPYPNENAYVRVNLTEDQSALPPGLYFLRAAGPYNPLDHILVVSKYNLTLKTAFKEAVVWATDQQSGQPVANLPITLRDSSFKIVASGNTNAQGLFRAAIPEGTLPDLWTVFYAFSEGNPDEFAAAMSQWSYGIEAWDFNLVNEFYPRNYTIYLYTDRPVYRPGQTVSFKGIMRAEDDARFTLPDVGTITVNITNDRGETVFEQDVTLNRFGTFSGEFVLADEASTGYYNISALGGSGNEYTAYLGFQVAEYRKPEFVVQVTMEKDEVVQGDTIRAEVKSQFFFGGAVSEAQVEWTLLAADQYFQYRGPGYYDFAHFDYTSGAGTPFYGTFGEVIASGSGLTDANGELRINIPADVGKKQTSQLFTLEATVTDVNGQSVSGRTSVVVHKGDFYLGIGPEQFVGKVGSATAFNVLAVDWQGEPRAGQKATVVYYLHEWFSVQEEDEFGNKFWTWSAKDTEVGRESIVTDANGKAVSSFMPETGGTFRATVSATDSGGRTVSASTYVWVTSTDFVSWRQENNNRVVLVPDRKEYKPGDTASILIPSPFQGQAKALVTVERGGIYNTEVITLSSNSTIYQLPITAQYAPDAYVSVVIVKGVDETNPAPAFRLGLARLTVSPEQQQINVIITPDQTKVGPRDTVTYKLVATDYLGKPVQAEFSIGLSDLAALSLAAPNSGPILDAFYGQRGLAVRTSASLTMSVDQLNVQTASVKGGGGGGLEEGFVEVRGDFRDTAYWNATVVTDANGEATVSIKLPDNLTTWRLDARGISVSTLVGQTTVDIVATKDLLVRPVTPRFFVVGDKVAVAAVVNNNTANDLAVEVTLSGSGFVLEGAAMQTVNVPANNRSRVEWTITAADAPAADLTFTAVSGSLSDASKPTLGLPPGQLLPIYKYSTPETIGTAGELSGQTSITELIALPRRYDASQGQLSVGLSPSLAAAMTDGLSYLENYNYECTEQIVSRFLPNVLTFRALKQLGIDDPALETRLTRLVNQGAQRLYARQHADGAWGWWSTDDSNAFITAYTLFGLNQARLAGFSVEAKSLENAANYLQNQVRTASTIEETWKLNRQAFMLFALADYGAGNVSATTQLYDERGRLDSYGRALLALTLHALDPQDARIGTLLGDFNNSAILSATGAHWEEESTDWRNMNTDTRSTAIVLSALAKLNPDSALATSAVRWLMSVRQNSGAWESTQETAWALIGLTDWMAATGDLKAQYDYSVTLNGTTLSTGTASAETLRTPLSVKVAVADLIKDQANRLLFSRTAGDGNLYYTAHLTVYQNVAEVRAQSKGIIVARKYTIPNGDCGGKDQPPCPPISSAVVGQDIKVTVTIIAPSDLHYVLIEDPFPAGTEPVDTSLLTTSVVGQAPELNPVNPLYYGWGWWWFSNTDIRDEKVTLFATYLPKGTYQYTYTLHASLAGTYNVIPTTGSEFYFPEVSGRGDGTIFTITPGE